MLLMHGDIINIFFTDIINTLLMVFERITGHDFFIFPWDRVRDIYIYFLILSYKFYRKAGHDFFFLSSATD